MAGGIGGERGAEGGMGVSASGMASCRWAGHRWGVGPVDPDEAFRHASTARVCASSRVARGSRVPVTCSPPLPGSVRVCWPCARFSLITSFERPTFLVFLFPVFPSCTNVSRTPCQGYMQRNKAGAHCKDLMRCPTRRLPRRGQHRSRDRPVSLLAFISIGQAGVDRKEAASESSLPEVAQPERDPFRYWQPAVEKEREVAQPALLGSCSERSQR